jgi:hypothetical protein
MNIYFKDNQVTINNKTVSVATPVKKVFVAGDRVLVMLYALNLTITTHPPHNNNILCFDAQGNELWVIDNPMLNPDPVIPHRGELDQWLYLGQGNEWGRDADAITVQSGNWICNVNLEDGSLYDCEPHK